MGEVGVGARPGAPAPPRGARRGAPGGGAGGGGGGGCGGGEGHDVGREGLVGGQQDRGGGDGNDDDGDGDGDGGAVHHHWGVRMVVWCFCLFQYGRRGGRVCVCVCV